MAIHVDLKAMVPPQNPGGAGDIDGGVEDHLAACDVLNKAGGVVGELERLEASREAEELTGAGRLGAGLDLSRAEEGTLVEDGHGGGGVVNGGDVGVGDVDGEKWNVGSLGFADNTAIAATADAAPIIAELQLHFNFLPIATRQSTRYNH
ncbi:hypothetical protein CR513_58314, partial [Mucuna pruriens]